MRTNSQISALLVGLTVLSSAIAAPGFMAQSANAQSDSQQERDITQLCGGPRREKNPQMCNALRDLLQARAKLERADRTYNGYRAKALQSTNEAIREIVKGLKSNQ